MLDVEQNRSAQKYSPREILGRIVWILVQPFFRFSPRPCFGWRRFLLRCLGAKIGRQVNIYGSATIYYPWKFEAGDQSAVGEHAYVYNLGSVIIGARTTISHRAHLCAGTHDYSKPDLPLLKPEIHIGSGCWVAAGAFVGPGATIGDNTVIGARSVVSGQIPPGVIAAGNPCRVIKQRPMHA